MIPSRHFPDQSEFFLLALFIRKNVVKERFYDEILPQFYADGLKYWTKGDPLETIYLLNRTKGEANHFSVKNNKKWIRFCYEQNWIVANL